MSCSNKETMILTSQKSTRIFRDTNRTLAEEEEDEEEEFVV